jgi:hypothetical protein
MIEEGTTECGVEKVIAKRKIFGDGSQRQVGGMKIAHHESSGVADGHEVVHQSAVDLHLLLIKAVDKISGLHCRAHIRVR